MQIEGVYRGGANPAKIPIQVGPNGELVLLGVPGVFQETAVGALAISTAAYTSVLDLGSPNPYRRLVLNKIGAASANEALSIECSSDGSTNWFTTNADSGAGIASSGTSATVTGVQGLVIARYARGKFANGLTAQTALLLRLAALVGS